MPKSLVPALLLIMVRFFAPRSRSAPIRLSGIPHRPNPETMIEAPSGMSATAAAALATTLFIRSAPCAMIPLHFPENPLEQLRLAPDQQALGAADERRV